MSKTKSNLRHLSLLAAFFFFVTLLPASSPASGLLSCETVPQLLKAYLVHHVKIREMSADVKKRTVDEYIKYLDPSKNLLLESEVNTLRKDLDTLFSSMDKGNCSVLEKINETVIAKLKENEDFVRKFVSKNDYKLDETVELVIDPEKRGYPKNKDELNQELVKSVHFQMSNYLDSGTKLPEAKQQLIHRYELITKRAKEDTREDLLSNFINAFASSLDPHSSYFSPEMLEDFQIQMGLSLEGIGASLTSENGYTVIQEVIPGGAADRAKILKPKDKIIAVSQDKGSAVNVIDMSLKDVVRLIRGKKNTKVTLTILRQGDKTERFETTIVRDTVDLKEQAAKLKIETREIEGKKRKLAVIDLPSFYGDKDRNKRSSYKDIRELLKQATAKKVDGLMLDLTRNAGGLLEDAVKISGLFIKSGGVVATKSSDDRTDVLDDRDEEILYSGPMVVLTSRRSASASEILAGAMKDYGRAIVVGDDHTFGKGTVQSVLTLPLGLGALKITTGMFFLPAGASTQQTGVPSDIVIPARFDLEEIGEKTADNSLPPQKIQPFKSESANFPKPPKYWEPISSDLIQALVKKSEARVKASEEFKEMQAKVTEAKRNKGVIKLSDMRKQQEKENKKKGPKDDEKPLSERMVEADLPQYNEALNVLADYVALRSKPTAALAEAPQKSAGDKKAN